jgi:acyl transferase domain-containing protein
MNNSTSFDSTNDVAVVGLNGRFPKARNLEEFWENLKNGVEAVSFFSEEELLASGLDPSVLDRHRYIRAKAILDDVELLDASFFGFTPREAALTDPQQRFFLECAWEALESAGYDSETFPGRIGVYAGVSMSTYLVSLYANRDKLGTWNDFRTLVGNDKDYLATWVSYKLNLTGPSLSVQTACSTSLVAVHLACQSLLNGECDMALAGGACISIPQKVGYLYEEEGILSRDGHCRAFDAKASGTVAGNGVGIVVLKRLADALNDGDTIHAVIKGSAINNDGALKVGFTAPGVKGQADVIAEVLGITGINPEDITYVETHGTGTELGDPIEIAALEQAFRTQTDKRGYCGIGSVKTNVGHLDAAAGITGLIKTILSLSHKQLPPSLHYEQPNPKIDFASSPFFVNDRLREWESHGGPRRAGVSSFGIGGTNAHVIVEEAPEVQESESRREWEVLVVSAKTERGLEEVGRRLAEQLRREREGIKLADVAWTLQVGRRGFGYRRAVVCRTIDDAIAALDSVDAGPSMTSFKARANPPVVWMFTGQGAQFANMGLELYLKEPVYRQQVDLCCELLLPHLGFDLRTLLYPSAKDSNAINEANERLKRTELTQPALFVVEYALAKLWMEWGIRPEAMIGHSIGEFVAACLSDVMSLEDALEVVALRGRLMQRMAEGAMLAVAMSAEELQPLLGEGLSLAVVNAPARCVVAGSEENIDRLERQLAERGSMSRRLHTSHAFHSEMMTPAVGEFISQLRRIKLKRPQIPFISNVTGRWITAEEATDAEYWGRHLRETVQFAKGLATLLEEPERVFVEVGPGQTLKSLVRLQTGYTKERVVLSTLPAVGEGGSTSEFLMKSLSRLWLAGIKIDWRAFHAHERLHRIPLSTYPFERKRYWFDSLTSHRSEHSAAENGKTKPDLTAQFPPTSKVNSEEIQDAVPRQGASEKIAAKPQTALAAIMEQQLQLMSEQLSLFSNGHARHNLNHPQTLAGLLPDVEEII